MNCHTSMQALLRCTVGTKMWDTVIEKARAETTQELGLQWTSALPRIRYSWWRGKWRMASWLMPTSRYLGYRRVCKYPESSQYQGSLLSRRAGWTRRCWRGLRRDNQVSAIKRLGMSGDWKAKIHVKFNILETKQSQVVPMGSATPLPLLRPASSYTSFSGY